MPGKKGKTTIPSQRSSPSLRRRWATRQRGKKRRKKLLGMPKSAKKRAASPLLEAVDPSPSSYSIDFLELNFSQKKA